MPRILLTAVLLLGLPAAASAQRFGGFGGGTRPVSPLAPTVSPLMPGISPMMPGISPTGTGVAGGFARPLNHGPGFHFPGVWGGYGGWFPFYGYGGYAYEVPVPVEIPVPVPVAVRPPDPPPNVSGEGLATLVLEFPSAAEVWVDGKKGPGEPNAVWTLTSQPLPLGTEYPFKVKARWTFNGKTYEYEKTVTVAAGNRSKALVVSGTEVKE